MACVSCLVFIFKNTGAGLWKIYYTSFVCTDPYQSLVNSAWIEAFRTYINDYNQAVPVLSTGLSEEDLRMFDRHGVAYHIE